MAIISYVGAELNPANSTFQDWLTKTNEIIGDMGEVVVTIGGNNDGDLTLTGVFAANSISTPSANIDILNVSTEILSTSISVSNNIITDTLTVSNNGQMGTLSVSGNTSLQAVVATDIVISGSVVSPVLTANTVDAETVNVDILTASTTNSPILNVSNTANIEVLIVSQTASINDLSATGNVSLSSTSATSLSVTGNTVLADTSATSLTAQTIEASNISVSGNSTFNNITVNDFTVNGTFNVDEIGTTANTVFQNIEVTGNTTFSIVTANTAYVESLEVGTLDVQNDAFFTRIESANNFLSSITSNTIVVSTLSVSGNSSLTDLDVTANTSLANTLISGTFTVSGNTTLANTTIETLSISGTGALKLPVGVSAQRPTGIKGQQRFNDTLGKMEVFNGVSWVQFREESSTLNVDSFTANTATINTVISDSYVEKYQAVLSTSNSTTIDLRNGNVFSHALTENTTFSFTNATQSGLVYGFTLEIIQDANGTGYTVNWPTIRWPKKKAPILTSTANGIDIFVFYTRDGGNTWYGFIAGQDQGVET